MKIRSIQNHSSETSRSPNYRNHTSNLSIKYIYTFIKLIEDSSRRMTYFKKIDSKKNKLIPLDIQGIND